MRALWLFALAALPAVAQEEPVMPAGDAITLEVCEKMRDQVAPRIETFTRMKFRRPVPMRIEPFAEWKKKVAAGNPMGTHALAYYTPAKNVVTIVPWVIGRYHNNRPVSRTRKFWHAQLEPTMIHELVHAIHHHNFFSEGRDFAASLKPAPPEHELDTATVSFLLGEGVPELVSLRTTEFRDHMGRRPVRLDSPAFYMTSYVGDGMGPYRLKLLSRGYQDGLNLAYAVQQRTGMRGIRAILYRPPPRQLLFDPDVLATVALEDPPDPDSVFGFLSPAAVKGRAVRLACNPGKDRFFKRTYEPRIRARGCLLGYVVEQNGARYGLFVADPDAPGTWSDEQRRSLLARNAAGATDTEAVMPVDSPRKARVQVVNDKDGSRWVRAEADGVVVLAHEVKPTENLRTRVLLALRVLHMHRPKPDLYAAAKKKAVAKLTD